MHKGNTTRWKLVCQYIHKEVFLTLKLVLFLMISKAKLFYISIFLTLEIQVWFKNCLYVLKTRRHERKMHCPECIHAQTHHAAKDPKRWLWKNMLNLTQTLNKKKGGVVRGIKTLKNVWYLKRFSTESRWNLWGSCFITHPDPCTAHTLLFTYSHMHSSQTGMTRTAYALQHIFLIYTLKYFNRNLLGPVIKKIKKKSFFFFSLRDVLFFKPYL